MGQEILLGKLKLTANLVLDSGLHIGGSSDFAPIGAVDSTFIRDPYTKQPMIPGSSLKGKIRSLLRRNEGNLGSKTESIRIKRLFGTADEDRFASRLQFYDVKMDPASVQEMNQLDTDTYLGEIKFENSIDPLTGEANPRQIERVPAGTVFKFCLVYDLANKDEVQEDMETLKDGIRLLEWDYLGGNGSRGYGRVHFENWRVESFTCHQDLDLTEIREQFQQTLQK
ncbi:MAG: type III-A CRISPR-associated RAMP protein Csm3 [Acidaminococcus fermentans]|uniref:type III-A CRISPR-associated RAMP protein Csm3 n=1 Tax=Acidaminococcus fermentans TaxID=905 RepID=UPI00242B642A|nr:type III-A CRISPR-associated RAMP protein Csm3 [Acidaminococcus fermentans]MCF0139915.1 type III-A CRISPR-associated RAMP protein Csm3 [Acidaminococcus fermentans]